MDIAAAAAIRTSAGIGASVEARSTDVVKPPEQWGPDELRDYVVRRIAETTGACRRLEAYKEQSIFSGFLRRWGAQAVPIARFAFEECQGRWSGAPIRIERFCANSDPWFAQKIAERL